MIDLFLIYQFIRRLVTPFEEWEAFKLGIIDERGNVLRKRRELRLKQERDAFGVFDLLVLNLKKLLEKLPAGQTKLASYAAALWLIREWKAFTLDSMLTEEVTESEIQESLDSFFSVITDYINTEEYVKENMNDINTLFEEKFVDEDMAVAPTNNVGSGNIPGTGPDAEPVIRKRKEKRMIRRFIPFRNEDLQSKQKLYKKHTRPTKPATIPATQPSIRLT